MRSKRVELRTLMRIVPRCASCRRNVLASRLTDTTLPSYWRVAAEATPVDMRRAEMMMRRKVVFMAAMLAIARPTALQRPAKTRLSRVTQVRVLVRELLGAGPRPAVPDRPEVEVDHLVGERAAVLDRQPPRAQA